MRQFYEKTRLPLVPIYGGIPVKLKTFVGDPIYPDPDVTPEELAEKVYMLQAMCQTGNFCQVPNHMITTITNKMITFIIKQFVLLELCDKQVIH